MKLSTRSRYGVRILIELGRQKKKGPVKISDISKHQGISMKYMEQLVRPLKKAGFVNSLRGPKGGHFLIKKPEEITLGQIVRLLEEKSDLVDCISRPETCRLSDDCRVREAWKEAGRALFDKLDSISIADLIKDKKPEGK
ncbi:MAG: Rrf2 family transcriptional regulator [Thermodesulfobacteriota bacterium]